VEGDPSHKDRPAIMDVLFLDAARTSWVMPLKPARVLKYDEIASGDSGDLKLSHQLFSVGK
jgi:hypothetical protein